MEIRHPHSKTPARKPGRHHTYPHNGSQCPHSQTPTENELASHFAALGLQEFRNESALERNLLKVFGEDRFEQFADLTERHSMGRSSVEDKYAIPKTLKEASEIVIELQVS